MNKLDAFNELRRRGIVRAVVSFSGGNDEGGVEQINLVSASGVNIQLEDYYPGKRWNETTQRYESPTSSADEELAAALGEPIYDRYGTFAGEYYVDGRLIWDVATGDVKIEADQRDTLDDEDGCRGCW